MTYVDGFVIPIPKKNIRAYKKMAQFAGKIWMKHGALQCFECMGEDLKTKDMGGMKALEFPRMTKAKPNETVWFSFIVFKSRKHRDEVNAKVIKAMNEAMKDQKDFQMPFDMKRMAYGGFEAVVEG